MGTDNLLDELLSGGGKTFFTKDDPVGRSVTGVVTAVSVRQVTSFETGKPEVWDDGTPKRQAVITLATGERDPLDGDDDGHRNIYVKMWGDQRRALAKAGTPAVGDTLTVTYTGTTPPAVKGLNPSKVYEFRLVKANPLDGPMAAPEPAPQAPPPAWTTGDPGGTASSSTQAAQPAAGPDTSKVAALRAAGLSDDQIVAATGLTLADVKGA
jgi:hypothetical protein